MQEASKKILSILTSLDSDFKKCEDHKTCLAKLDQAQKDNAKNIRTYIAKYQAMPKELIGQTKSSFG